MRNLEKKKQALRFRGRNEEEVLMVSCVRHSRYKQCTTHKVIHKVDTQVIAITAHGWLVTFYGWMLAVAYGG